MDFEEECIVDQKEMMNNLFIRELFSKNISSIEEFNISIREIYNFGLSYIDKQGYSSLNYFIFNKDYFKILKEFAKKYHEILREIAIDYGR